MSINFPSNLDALPNPTGTDLLENATTALDHDQQHANANDAIEALEAKVGANSSAVTTSHDYKLGEVTSSDKAVGKTATQTLTNKTLTAPKITAGSDAQGDIFQLLDASGTLTRIRATLNADIISWNSGTSQWEAIPNPAATNASTSVKGVVEEATLAETLARTGAGGTGARIFVSPTNMPAVLYHDYAADSVGSDSYAITVTPVPVAYTAGDVYVFKAGTLNTAGATLNVNTLGAKTIKKNYNVDLETGDILANQIVVVVYDGTNFQMISAPATLVTYKNGNTTLSGAGPTTIAHGLGKTPKKVRVSAFYTSGSGTYTATFSNGSYDSGSQSAAGIGYGIGGAATLISSNSVAISLNIGGAAFTGTISVDATNITVTHNANPGVTIQLAWDAEA